MYTNVCIQHVCVYPDVCIQMYVYKCIHTNVSIQMYVLTYAWMYGIGLCIYTWYARHVPYDRCKPLRGHAIRNELRDMERSSIGGHVHSLHLHFTMGLLGRV